MLSADAVFRARSGKAPLAHFRDAQEMLLSPLARPRGPRLVVTAPPGHGASTWLALMCGMALAQPGSRVVHCTGAANNGAHFSAKRAAAEARNRERLLEYARTATEEGARGTVTSGPLGAVKLPSEERVTFLGIDSPFHNSLEARVPALVERAAAWICLAEGLLYEGASGVVLASGRYCVPGGDLVERLEARGWQWLNLPALSSEGAPLWPSRWPLEKLAEVKLAVGEEEWWSTYQGSLPQPLHTTGLGAELQAVLSQPAPSMEAVVESLRRAVGHIHHLEGELGSARSGLGALQRRVQELEVPPARSA